MSDEEKFLWEPKFDRKSGIIRIPPIIMKALGLEKPKKDILFDIILKKRNNKETK